MDGELSQTKCSAEVKNFFSQVVAAFDSKPFKPYRFFLTGNAQTFGAYAWPRKYRRQPEPEDEDRLFDVERNVQILAKCRWQANRRAHPTLAAWHGMEGSTSSIYMIAIADKAFRAGFNVVRVNYRNCGGTEHLSETLYHGGMSSDLKKVIEELVAEDGLDHLYLLGFSLGGNMALKLAGEYGMSPPKELRALCVVSPSVDLRASTDLITARRNWLYGKNFFRSLKKRIVLKHKLYPELYDLSRLSQIRTIRDFDEEYTCRSNGFINADDYYHQSSSIRIAHMIRLPTLIIHAKDDPFIPFEPLNSAAFSENPFIMTVATDKGGHVAFVSARTPGDEDRFWAENRAIEFFTLAERHRWCPNL